MLTTTDCITNLSLKETAKYSYYEPFFNKNKVLYFKFKRNQAC